MNGDGVFDDAEESHPRHRSSSTAMSRYADAATHPPPCALPDWYRHSTPNNNNSDNSVAPDDEVVVTAVTTPATPPSRSSNNSTGSAGSNGGRSVWSTAFTAWKDKVIGLNFLSEIQSRLGYGKSATSATATATTASPLDTQVDEEETQKPASTSSHQGTRGNAGFVSGTATTMASAIAQHPKRDSLEAPSRATFGEDGILANSSSSSSSSSSRGLPQVAKVQTKERESIRRPPWDLATNANRPKSRRIGETVYVDPEESKDVFPSQLPTQTLRKIDNSRPHGDEKQSNSTFGHPLWKKSFDLSEDVQRDDLQSISQTMPSPAPSLRKQETDLTSGWNQHHTQDTPWWLVGTEDSTPITPSVTSNHRQGNKHFEHQQDNKRRRDVGEGGVSESLTGYAVTEPQRQDRDDDDDDDEVIVIDAKGETAPTAKFDRSGKTRTALQLLGTMKEESDARSRKRPARPEGSPFPSEWKKTQDVDATSSIGRQDTPVAAVPPWIRDATPTGNDQRESPKKRPRRTTPAEGEPSETVAVQESHQVTGREEARTRDGDNYVSSRSPDSVETLPATCQDDMGVATRSRKKAKFEHSETERNETATENSDHGTESENPVVAPVANQDDGARPLRRDDEGISSNGVGGAKKDARCEVFLPLGKTDSMITASVAESNGLLSDASSSMQPPQGETVEVVTAGRMRTKCSLPLASPVSSEAESNGNTQPFQNVEERPRHVDRATSSTADTPIASNQTAVVEKDTTDFSPREDRETETVAPSTSPLVLLYNLLEIETAKDRGFLSWDTDGKSFTAVWDTELMERTFPFWKNPRESIKQHLKRRRFVEIRAGENSRVFSCGVTCIQYSHVQFYRGMDHDELLALDARWNKTRKKRSRSRPRKSSSHSNVDALASDVKTVPDAVGHDDISSDIVVSVTSTGAQQAKRTSDPTEMELSSPTALGLLKTADSERGITRSDGVTACVALAGDDEATAVGDIGNAALEDSPRSKRRFCKRLHAMIGHADASGCLWWDGDGKSFVMIKKHEVLVQLLHLNFPLWPDPWDAFLATLRYYGFSTTFCAGSRKIRVSHPEFCREASDEKLDGIRGKKQRDAFEKRKRKRPSHLAETVDDTKISRDDHAKQTILRSSLTGNEAIPSSQTQLSPMNTLLNVACSLAGDENDTPLLQVSSPTPRTIEDLPVSAVVAGHTAGPSTEGTADDAGDAEETMEFPNGTEDNGKPIEAGFLCALHEMLREDSAKKCGILCWDADGRSFTSIPQSDAVLYVLSDYFSIEDSYWDGFVNHLRMLGFSDELVTEQRGNVASPQRIRFRHSSYCRDSSPDDFSKLERHARVQDSSHEDAREAVTEFDGKVTGKRSLTRRFDLRQQFAWRLYMMIEEESKRSSGVASWDEDGLSFTLSTDKRELDKATLQYFSPFEWCKNVKPFDSFLYRLRYRGFTDTLDRADAKPKKRYRHKSFARSMNTIELDKDLGFAGQKRLKSGNRAGKIVSAELNFPETLFRMLNEETGKKSSVMSWDFDGRSFSMLTSPNSALLAVLKSHFPSSKDPFGTLKQELKSFGFIHDEFITTNLSDHNQVGSGEKPADMPKRVRYRHDNFFRDMSPESITLSVAKPTLKTAHTSKSRVVLESEDKSGAETRVASTHSISSTTRMDENNGDVPEKWTGASFFPVLMKLLDDQSAANSKLISWDEDGRSFTLSADKAALRKVMKPYFLSKDSVKYVHNWLRTRNFVSRKWKGQTDVAYCTYRHEKFFRGASLDDLAALAKVPRIREEEKLLNGAPASDSDGTKSGVVLESLQNCADRDVSTAENKRSDALECKTPGAESKPKLRESSEVFLGRLHEMLEHETAKGSDVLSWDDDGRSFTAVTEKSDKWVTLLERYLPVWCREQHDFCKLLLSNGFQGHVTSPGSWDEGSHREVVRYSKDGFVRDMHFSYDQRSGTDAQDNSFATEFRKATEGACENASLDPADDGKHPFLVRLYNCLERLSEAENGVLVWGSDGKSFVLYGTKQVHGGDEALRANFPEYGCNTRNRLGCMLRSYGFQKERLHPQSKGMRYFLGSFYRGMKMEDLRRIQRMSPSARNSHAADAGRSKATLTDLPQARDNASDAQSRVVDEEARTRGVSCIGRPRFIVQLSDFLEMQSKNQSDPFCWDSDGLAFTFTIDRSGKDIDSLLRSSFAQWKKVSDPWDSLEKSLAKVGFKREGTQDSTVTRYRLSSFRRGMTRNELESLPRSVPKREGRVEERSVPKREGSVKERSEETHLGVGRVEKAGAHDISSTQETPAARRRLRRYCGRCDICLKDDCGVCEACMERSQRGTLPPSDTLHRCSSKLRCHKWRPQQDLAPSEARRRPRKRSLSRAGDTEDENDTTRNSDSTLAAESQEPETKALEPPSPVPNLPNSGRCAWSFNPETRVLLANFRQECGRVEVDGEDELFLKLMMERDDLTVVCEGLADNLDGELWDLAAVARNVEGEFCHKFRAFQKVSLNASEMRHHAGTNPDGSSIGEAGDDDVRRFVTYEEKPGFLSMRMSQYVEYLDMRQRALQRRATASAPKEIFELSSEKVCPEGHEGDQEDMSDMFCFENHRGEEKTINVVDVVLYLLDYDVCKLMPPLYEDFANKFKLPGALPGGSYCMMNSVNPGGRPFMGPNLYITPPASFTHLHQDGHGTVDSGHQCISGYNEVVMLRRMPEAHKRNALRILQGNNPTETGTKPYDALYGLPHGDENGEKPMWPTISAITKCEELNYCPSVFVLKPGQFVHINKGRLHAFRKLSLDTLPEADCHYAQRNVILSEEIGDSSEPLCISLAWDWMYRGMTSAGIRAEVESTLECAALNREHGKQSLAIPETCMLQVAKLLCSGLCTPMLQHRMMPMLPRFGGAAKTSGTKRRETARTVLRGILPSLRKLVQQHQRDYELIKGRAEKSAELSVVNRPNSWEIPENFALDPYGNTDFFCKLCHQELSNLYLHCDGCEELLCKDFNICVKCHTAERHKIFMPMHPCSVKMNSAVNHTGKFASRKSKCSCGTSSSRCERCHDEVNMLRKIEYGLETDTLEQSSSVTSPDKSEEVGVRETKRAKNSDDTESSEFEAPPSRVEPMQLMSGPVRSGLTVEELRAVVEGTPNSRGENSFDPVSLGALRSNFPDSSQVTGSNEKIGISSVEFDIMICCYFGDHSFQECERLIPYRSSNTLRQFWRKIQTVELQPGWMASAKSTVLARLGNLPLESSKMFGDEENRNQDEVRCSVRESDVPQRLETEMVLNGSSSEQTAIVGPKTVAEPEREEVECVCTVETTPSAESVEMSVCSRSGKKGPFPYVLHSMLYKESENYGSFAWDAEGTAFTVKGKCDDTMLAKYFDESSLDWFLNELNEYGFVSEIDVLGNLMWKRTGFRRVMTEEELSNIRKCDRQSRKSVAGDKVEDVEGSTPMKTCRRADGEEDVDHKATTTIAGDKVELVEGSRNSDRTAADGIRTSSLRSNIKIETEELHDTDSGSSRGDDDEAPTWKTLRPI